MQNWLKSVDTGGCCPIGSGRESRKISLLRVGAHSVSGPCCPIEVGQIEEAEAVPEHAPDKGEEASKAVRPLAGIGDVSEKNIQQQRGPQLPADGLLGVTEEVTDLEGLLDLFKEGFNSPAATIQVADTGRSPLEVIGEENHENPFAVDLHVSLDPPQSLRVLATGLGQDEGDLVVTDYVPVGLEQAFCADVISDIILGPGDPEDTSLMQVEKVGKVNVGFVKDGHFTGLEPGTKSQGTGTVVVGSFLDDSKGGKETLQVQSQVHLRGRLSAPVLGPVHAVGHQGDGGGIHRMDSALEAVRQTPVASGRTKSRGKLLQMLKHLPEKSLHHLGVAILVRVRKGIAAWGHRSPDHRQSGCVMAQRVADIVQSDGMGQLCKKQTHYMAPGRKGARLFIDPVFAGQFLRQVRRDKFTKLMQCVRIMLGRRYLFHTTDSLVGIRRRPPFFYSVHTGLQLHPVG